MDEYASLIQNSVNQNNEWSAAQAQKQMDFQERMSSTAHQREVEDLKAAGLNPVLSAKLGGASTPTGAMGATDTGMTSALVDLLQLSMETANSAAGAAYSATSGDDDNLFGLPSIKNPRQPWQIAYNWLITDDKTKSGASKLQSAVKNFFTPSAKDFAEYNWHLAQPAYGITPRHKKGSDPAKKWWQFWK